MKAWIEVTNLLSPGHKYSSTERDEGTAWIAGPLGTGMPARPTVARADDRIRDVPRRASGRARRKRADAVDGLHARVRTAPFARRSGSG